MSFTGTVKQTWWWKDISVHVGKQPTYPRLAEYLASKQHERGFPFIIVSDHIPHADELLSVLTGDLLHGQEKRPFVVALHNTETGNRQECWQLLDLGIQHIIEWEDEDELIDFAERLYQRHKTIQDILESDLVKKNLVGQSSRWNRFLFDIIEATLFSQASLLLVGESGTGKELISRLIHTLDTREPKKKLIIVDCTTIVPELSGSELFGHERGSYTNALQSREGAFALANNGTLFLDEVGELPLPLQAELLRVLQEGTYKKVGSNTWQKTDFRLICATNKDLRKAVTKGRFRQDLYYRIADCEYAVPSLEERKEDVPLLVNCFLAQLFPGNKLPEVDKLVMNYLVQRVYPGNIRELRQLVQRIALRHVQYKKISIGDIPINDRPHLCERSSTNGHPDNMTTLIRNALLTGENWWNLKTRISETAIQVALDLEGNNKQKAAERLSVDVRTVQQYVKKKTSQG